MVYPCDVSPANVKFPLEMCEVSHYLGRMTETQNLLHELEAAAADLGMAASTLGRLVGQGGRFHARLAAGKRVWPETAEKVRENIAALKDRKAEPDQGEPLS